MILAGALLAGCPLGFAPPLDRPLTIVTIDERELNGQRHVFTQSRRLSFARSETGYRATLVQTAVEADAAPPVARALIAGSGAFTGLPIVFTIAADGCTARIDDVPSARRGLVAAEARMVAAASDEPGRALTRRLLAPLLALDDAALAGFLLAMIQPLLPAGVEATPGPAARQAASPLGGAVALAGERSVTAHGGATHIATRLTSAADAVGQAVAARRAGIAGGDSSTPASALVMRVAIDQALDAATGMVGETRTVTELFAPGPVTLETLPAHRIVSTTRIGDIAVRIGR